MKLAQDEETQKRGVVGVMYMVEQPDALLAGNPQAHWETTRLRAACPLRFCAQHMCTDNPHLKGMLIYGMLVMGTLTRARHRDHFGRCYGRLPFGVVLYLF
jgi:hypothetical protein